MKIVLATHNRGKVAEMQTLLSGVPVEVVSVLEWPDAPIVEEDGETLEANARKKAEAVAAHTGLPALADDTGLEVEALGGRPGVYSARFAGPEADDAANRAHLLAEMEGVSERAARFRTVLAFCEKGGVTYFEGSCSGRLLEEERGSEGFGYDALFVPEGEERTFAEMSKVEKNVLSHRGRALRAFLTYLARRLG